MQASPKRPSPPGMVAGNMAAHTGLCSASHQTCGLALQAPPHGDEYSSVPLLYGYQWSDMLVKPVQTKKLHLVKEVPCPQELQVRRLGHRQEAAPGIRLLQDLQLVMVSCMCTHRAASILHCDRPHWFGMLLLRLLK